MCGNVPTWRDRRLNLIESKGQATPPKMTQIVPVLLAGGSGTRLWPLSREQHPKQFLKLLRKRSLLQDTALRACALDDMLPSVVLCSYAHRFLVADQLSEVGIGDATVILEPTGRGTAAAAAVAAHHVAARHGRDTLLLLMPADQVMKDPKSFQLAVTAAVSVANTGKIVTFGVKPTRAETGFGYIRAGASIGSTSWAIASFVEKPDAERAKVFFEEGGYYWNGGMFLFPVALFLDEIESLEPETSAAVAEALTHSRLDLGFLHLEAQAFSRTKVASIDCAVMERTDKGALVPLDAGWDDVGSWRFLDDAPKDSNGNMTSGDVVLEAATDNLVYAESRLVALAGVDNHIVVETKDAILITTRDHAQDVKSIVARLGAAKREEIQDHPQVYRPWGSYETIGFGARFQVKRIIVKAGCKLSLQKHHHRAEHWVVVRGTAQVTCDEKTFLMHENQSTYIPLGANHRLENPGVIALELIEVQSGPYLGEDDIVRLEDAYGRSPA